MLIGIPKEIKTMENRVSMTPGAVETLVRRGHAVVVEEGAGVGSGLSDEEYVAAGARMVTADEAWAAEMVIKVKEPIASEYKYLRDDLLLLLTSILLLMKRLPRLCLRAGPLGSHMRPCSFQMVLCLC